MSNLRWKWALLVLLLVVFGWYLVPTIRYYTMDPAERSSQSPKVAKIRLNAMKLGLDLQGGSYLVYEVDMSKIPEKDRRGDEVDRAIEIIRNRVDQFGVSEPVIQKQGANRIVVQLPGLRDPERAKAIIGRTAQLEFRLVDEGASPANPPPEDEVLWDREGNPYVVRRRTLLTGDLLADARVRIDPEFNQPYVFLRFNRRGARIFDRITARNVGRRLAIVLDRKVYSAPVIRERIPGGRAQITGRFFTPPDAPTFSYDAFQNEEGDLALLLHGDKKDLLYHQDALTPVSLPDDRFVDEDGDGVIDRFLSYHRLNFK